MDAGNLELYCLALLETVNLEVCSPKFGNKIVSPESRVQHKVPGGVEKGHIGDRKLWILNLITVRSS